MSWTSADASLTLPKTFLRKWAHRGPSPTTRSWRQMPNHPFSTYNHHRPDHHSVTNESFTSIAHHRLLEGGHLAVGDRIFIRKLTPEEGAAAVEVINVAARWYREFLPPEDFHDPEMDETQWRNEGRRMTWWGAFLRGTLVGVMGCEPIGEVALLRHAYILPCYQRRGVATALRENIEKQLVGIRRIIVGTYAANYKARGILEKGGYHLSSDSEAVLRTYYEIPEDRLQTSVTFEKCLSTDS